MPLPDQTMVIYNVVITSEIDLIRYFNFKLEDAVSMVPGAMIFQL